MRRQTITRNIRRFAPFPELADPHSHHGYGVLDEAEIIRNIGRVEQAATDKQARLMAIPLTLTGVEVSRHEMGHAKWSPVIKPVLRDKVAKNCMEAVEEARVNLGLRHLGLPFAIVDPFDKMGLEAHECDLLDGKYARAVVRMVVVMGTTLEERIVENTVLHARNGDERAEWVLEIVDAVKQKMERARGRKTVPTFMQGRRVADWLEKQLRRKAKPGDDMEGQMRSTTLCFAGVCSGKIRKKDTTVLEMHYRGPGPTGKYGGFGDWVPKKWQFFSPNRNDVVPGIMHIHRPPLVIKIANPELERQTKARSAEEGTEFRYIERFVSDQRVFKRRARKRKGGGTVLLDISSTMSLTNPEVMRIVAGAPDATKVATYCGLAGGTGRLSIVVDKGKRATNKEITNRYGNGNVIDVHALDWLSYQPEPRVWFTDGGVTGKGHCTDENYRDVCQTIVQENGIIQCRSIKKVCAALKREMEDEAGVFRPRDSGSDRKGDRGRA